LIGKRCKIHILFCGVDLYYTADVIGVSSTHISFVDKFKEQYSYRLQDVVETNIIRTLPFISDGTSKEDV
jgi:hypothetical protein